ncbi:MAG: transcription-repair coupling factor [Desulfobulbus propionicus]|nr:MAG: transcription-repair coupling factor [Desulfobulbus propionicus]
MTLQETLIKLGANTLLPPDISGLNSGSTGLFLSRAAEYFDHPICCIAAADEELEFLAQDIGLFSGHKVLVYPSFEIPPYTPLAPDPTTVGNRLSTLYRIQENEGPAIILTSIEAIIRRVLPKKALQDHCELVMTGEDFDRDALVRSLINAGYQQTELVRQQGDLALRGGILDIYSPSASPEHTGPVRLDFFGETLESIRVFDPLTQRSRQELEEAVLLPASGILFTSSDAHKPLWKNQLFNTGEQYGWPSEAIYQIQEQCTARDRFPGIELLLPVIYGGADKLHSFFDYLGAGTRLFLSDPLSIQQKLALLYERIKKNYQEAVSAGQAACPPPDLFLAPEELHNTLEKWLSARLVQLPDPEKPDPPLTIRTGDHALLRQEIELQRKKRGLLAPLADRIISWLTQQQDCLLACKSSRQANHLSEMLADYQLRCRRVTAPIALQKRGPQEEIVLVDHPLSKGFDLLDEGYHVLSASELFGEKRLQAGRSTRKTRHQGQPVPLEELQQGDIVVHREHGVGVFDSLINMACNGQQGDYLSIIYKGNDKLYVPVDKLHWISKYQGLTDQQPKLDSLGSQKWQATKKKVTDAVWKVAQELLQIYAQRAVRQGHRFSQPGAMFQQLEESFPYEETRGQAEAIDSALDDLTSTRPMDRLVCGDVGYGKTEVAVRAAFKVIEDGFQVGILVPTTVLAEQHAAVFKDRFSSFPVIIASLNRFRTAKEQREITTGITNGTIDLVIGTHRLLSKDVRFKKLGLLIIDEEHRFGVSHKEKIKKIKASVDVLTLTATPIPRTLQMSLLGIRDLSVISTPPQQRREVKTFLAKHDPLVIREAVARELQRGGQLFFVHNRVRTIYRAAENISELVPHARVGVAHGQMPGPQLEEIMVAFINHAIDILVCTTIIESGLDIPNANTIIINRADHLGLADIYQLRGRVGRSSRQAFAYLLVPALESLSTDAKQRLRALMNNSDLGSGFKLAMNDLQIRGGGNLLGVSQSGHIAAVGYDLYLELLQTTVAELKQKAGSRDAASLPDIDPEVKLQISAFFSDRYIPDTAQRYQLYRRLAGLSRETEIELADLADEIIDRYGPMPPEAKNLLATIALKQRLRKQGVVKLEQGPSGLIVSFMENPPFAPQHLLNLISQKPAQKHREQQIRLTPDQRLVVPLQEEPDLFIQIQALLNKLEELPRHDRDTL